MRVAGDRSERDDEVAQQQHHRSGGPPTASTSTGALLLAVPSSSSAGSATATSITAAAAAAAAADTGTSITAGIRRVRSFGALSPSTKRQGKATPRVTSENSSSSSEVMLRSRSASLAPSTSSTQQLRAHHSRNGSYSAPNSPRLGPSSRNAANDEQRRRPRVDTAAAAQQQQRAVYSSSPSPSSATLLLQPVSSSEQERPFSLAGLGRSLTSAAAARRRRSTSRSREREETRARSRSPSARMVDEAEREGEERVRAAREDGRESSEQPQAAGVLSEDTSEPAPHPTQQQQQRRRSTFSFFGRRFGGGSSATAGDSATRRAAQQRQQQQQEPPPSLPDLPDPSAYRMSWAWPPSAAAARNSTSSSSPRAAGSSAPPSPAATRPRMTPTLTLTTTGERNAPVVADDEERTAAPPTRAQQDQTGYFDALFAAERVAAVAMARRAPGDADSVDMARRRGLSARDGGGGAAAADAKEELILAASAAHTPRASSELVAARSRASSAASSPPLRRQMTSASISPRASATPLVASPGSATSPLPSPTSGVLKKSLSASTRRPATAGGMLSAVASKLGGGSSTPPLASRSSSDERTDFGSLFEFGAAGRKRGSSVGNAERDAHIVDPRKRGMTLSGPLAGTSTGPTALSPESAPPATRRRNRSSTDPRRFSVASNATASSTHSSLLQQLPAALNPSRLLFPPGSRSSSRPPSPSAAVALTTTSSATTAQTSTRSPPASRKTSMSTHLPSLRDYMGDSDAELLLDDSALVERLVALAGRSEVARLLAGAPEHTKALQLFMDATFDFTDEPLDVALRRFLMQCTLPTETQQVDRVVEAFSRTYNASNPGLFANKDAPYILAFSLVMLSTDHFNPNNKSKMTKADYCRNARLDGVPREFLEYLYDQITITPFIFVEDDQPDLHSSSSASLFSLGASQRERAKVDPYYLIAKGLTGDLKVNVDARVPPKSPYSFSGTTSFFNSTPLHQTFAQAPSAAFATVEANGAPGSTTLKCVKSGVLARKEDLLDGGRKAPSRKWKSWTVILTTSQLLFYKDAALAQVPASAAKPRPDAVLSLSDAITVYDVSYDRYPNVFRLITGSGRQFLLQSETMDEMNTWIALVNYAATFKTANVRMRPFMPRRTNSLGSLRRRVSSKRNSREVAPLRESTASNVPAVDADDSSDVAHSLREAVQRDTRMMPRSEALRRKVDELDGEITTAQGRLHEDLRQARHVGILTPFLRSTRDRIATSLLPIARRVRESRLLLVRIICYRELLARELLVEEREEARARKVSHGSLHGSQNGSGASHARNGDASDNESDGTFESAIEGYASDGELERLRVAPMMQRSATDTDSSRLRLSSDASLFAGGTTDDELPTYHYTAARTAARHSARGGGGGATSPTRAARSPASPPRRSSSQAISLLENGAEMRRASIASTVATFATADASPRRLASRPPRLDSLATGGGGGVTTAETDEDPTSLLSGRLEADEADDEHTTGSVVGGGERLSREETEDWRRTRAANRVSLITLDKLNEQEVEALLRLKEGRA